MRKDEFPIVDKFAKDKVNDVLDKIREEVADVHLIGYATVNGKREIASKAVMEIIDKYKAESEAADL